jgi:hypothetical protein
VAAQGFGLWLAFLFWILLSATQLDEARHCHAFSYRAALYLSMTVLFLYVFNLPAAVPAWRNVLALTLFWATVICLGFAALAAPGPAHHPGGGAAARGPGGQPLRPEPGRRPAGLDLHRLPLPRPAAPFTYTNQWGGAVGLLTLLAMADLGLLRSYLSRNLVRLLLAASLVPIVVSASRGLWIGLGAGWPCAVRAALAGNARLLAGIVGSLAPGRRPGRLYPTGALRRRPAGPPAQQRAPVQPSSSSALSCGVEVLELDAGVLGREPPVDPTTGPVARRLPGGDLSLQGRPIGQATVQALPGQHGQLDLGQVQPAAVLGV